MMQLSSHQRCGCGASAPPSSSTLLAQGPALHQPSHAAQPEISAAGPLRSSTARRCSAVVRRSLPDQQHASPEIRHDTRSGRIQATLRTCVRTAAAATALSAMLLLGPGLGVPGPAQALLNSPNAQVARSVEAALRRSIPAFNPEVSKVQKNLEDIQYLLRIPQRKPWGSMSSNLASALAVVSPEPVARASLLEGTPGGEEGQRKASELADELLKRLQQLDLAVRTQQADLVALRVSQSLQAVSELELMQAPGLSFVLPRDYVQQGLPVLTGRATVELQVEKKDGATAFVDRVNGGLTRIGRVRIVLDGYSAPLSAGNFAVNVQDGLYNDTVVQSGFSSVFVANGQPSQPRPPIPLEILPVGEFDPVYRLPLDVRSGELPRLPLSISGAVSMAHVPGSDSYLSGDEWFIFKFDKQQAGLSGLAFDEGTFGVFGYVTEGMEDVVGKLQSGDVIVKAELVAGQDKLQRPQQQQQAAAQ